MKRLRKKHSEIGREMRCYRESSDVLEQRTFEQLYVQLPTYDLSLISEPRGDDVGRMDVRSSPQRRLAP
jgi:hypothetical protein